MDKGEGTGGAGDTSLKPTHSWGIPKIILPFLFKIRHGLTPTVHPNRMSKDRSGSS